MGNHADGSEPDLQQRVPGKAARQWLGALTQAKAKTVQRTKIPRLIDQRFL
jgi:hypothetical protein